MDSQFHCSVNLNPNNVTNNSQVTQQIKHPHMKKTLTTLALVAVCAGAFAQGKISFLNDASRAVTWGTSENLKQSDGSLAGTAVANTGPGALLLVDLWGGTSAGTMTLQTTTVISAAAGLFGPYNFISANLAGATTYTMQVQVRDGAFATAQLAQDGGGYYGFSPLFTFRPSSTIAYNSIINQGGTALSTWAPGLLTVQAVVPEPSSMALAGLGAASLLIFRRRK